jgi:hypothetical protein
MAPLVFAAAVACLLLPFLTVSADQRRGTGTGFQLVARSARFHGSYVQGAYAGEVEDLVHNATTPMRLLLAIIVIGLCSAVLPFRRATQAALGAGVVGLVLMYVVQAVSSSRFHPPDSHVRVGYWAVLGLLFTVVAWATWLLRRRREDDEPSLGWPTR